MKKKYWLVGAGILIGLALGVAGFAKAATVLFPSGGGTGTSTPPTLGQVLVGNSSGTYSPQATSTLGISGSSIATPVSIANGGTNTGTQTTNGVNYFDGTKITSGSTFLTDGTQVGVGPNPLANLFQISGTYITAAGYLFRNAGILTSSNTGQQDLQAVAANFNTSGGSVTTLVGFESAPGILATSSSSPSFFFNGIQTGLSTQTGLLGTIPNGAGLYIVGPTIGTGNNPITNYSTIYSAPITNGNGITSGTVTNEGLRFQSMTAAAASGGTVNNYGALLNLSTGSGAGTTNNRAIYITGNGGTGGAGTTNNYGIYNDSTANNYFAGNLGIGVTVPTSKLVVAGNTLIQTEATTSTAALYVQGTGTSFTTATAGDYFGVNMPTTFTGSAIDIRQNGTQRFNVSSAGTVSSAVVGNLNTANNSQVQFNNAGLFMGRNVADSNPAVIISQTNAASTGDILQLKNSAGTVLSVAQTGTTTSSNGFNITSGCFSIAGTCIGGGGGSGTVTSVGLTAPTGLTVSGSPVTTSGTLALSLTAGYNIPLTASTTDWNTAYVNRITSLTTSGTSGAATLTGNTLNIPNYANTTYTAGTGLTLGAGAFSVNTSQNISTLSNLTTNGLIKTSGGTGALSIAIAGTDYQAAGNYITALTGDITASGPGSAAATLATVNSNIGTFNTLTVNAKGLVTAASNTTYQAPITLTTTGSGAATFVSNTLNIPTPAAGYSPVGTTGQFPYFSATNTLTATSSIFLTSASNVGIGTSTPTNKLDVLGSFGVSQLGAAEGSGGTITHVGGRTIHTFTTGGTFTAPAGVTSVQALVVGGGGGGGYNAGGGGGAGQFTYNATFTVVPGAPLSVSIGTGGTAGTSAARGGTGGSTVFSSITSTGGGGGGSRDSGQISGTNGSGAGGGGGAGATDQGTPSGGTGTQGGGLGVSNGTHYTGGGGGGATGTGTAGNATTALAGPGGAGTSNSNSGSAVTYAGGGGGGVGDAGSTAGAGGAGGGGAGGTIGNAGTAGTANTGGGGGGGSGANGGIGGSGIVIVSYPTPTPSVSSKFTVDVNGNVGIGTSTPTALFAIQSLAGQTSSLIAQMIVGVNYVVQTIDSVGHLITGGPAPTANSCAGFAVTGDDRTGVITLTSATSCSITFANAWPTAPVCTISPGSVSTVAQSARSTTGTTFSFGSPQTSFGYTCQTHQ